MNDLSPLLCQAITWTSTNLLSFGPFAILNGISISIWNFSLKKMYLKVLYAKCEPFCSGLNVLTSFWIQKSSLFCLWVKVTMKYWEFAVLINTLRPGQNGRHFPDDVFKYIFLHENKWILIKIPLKIVPKGPINNTCIMALVQRMAWRRPGDKPLQGLKLTLIPRSDFLLLLSKSWSKSDRHRSYFLSLKANIWLDWVAKLCS